ncbi:MAG TPA: hypothetical protein VFE46_17715 [Pirellulales bacterium]|jgi:hypothetical protein|nr:hypothetical protein [Pirellulales bacterium]
MATAEIKSVARKAAAKTTSCCTGAKSTTATETTAAETTAAKSTTAKTATGIHSTPKAASETSAAAHGARSLTTTKSTATAAETTARWAIAPISHAIAKQLIEFSPCLPIKSIGPPVRAVPCPAAILGVHYRI